MPQNRTRSAWAIMSGNDLFAAASSSALLGLGFRVRPFLQFIISQTIHNDNGGCSRIPYMRFRSLLTDEDKAL